MIKQKMRKLMKYNRCSGFASKLNALRNLNCFSFYLLVFFIFPLFISAQDQTMELVAFSHEAGFYNGEICLSLEGNADSFRYTTDGTEPNNESTLYSACIRIARTTAIRVKPVVKGELIDTMIVRTFFIDYNTGFPVFSLTISPDHFYSGSTGIYVRGPYSDNPDSMQFWNSFRGWERPLYAEFFETDKSLKISQPCGVKIHGGITKSYPEKSLQLIARQEYGDKRFRYAFFEDRDNSKYKRIILRTSGNDFRKTRFRDALSVDIVKELGLEHQAYRYCNLFVNGEYWGIYNIREKINEDFLKSSYGANPDSCELLQGKATAEHGNNKYYSQMLDFLSKNSFQSDQNIDSLESYMDIDNYITYRIFEIFINNIDSRGNVRFWRPVGGQFRWIVYDTDYGYGASMKAHRNYLHDRLKTSGMDWYNPLWCTLILRKLMENENVRNQFVNQYCYLLSTSLSTDSLLIKTDRLIQNLTPEMKPHLEKRNSSFDQWNTSINVVKNFAKLRPGFAFQHLKDEFSLGDDYRLSVSIVPQKAGSLSINKNRVRSQHFYGRFFKSVSLPLEVEENPLWVFQGWSGEYGASPSIMLKTDSDSVNLIARFRRVENSPAEKMVFVNEIIAKKTAKGQLKLKFELYSDLTDKMICEGWKVYTGSRLMEFNDTILEQGQSYTVMKNRKSQKPIRISKADTCIYILDGDRRIVDSINVSGIFDLVGHDTLEVSFALPDLHLDNSNISLFMKEEPSPNKINHGLRMHQEEEKEKKYITISLISVGGLVFVIVLIFMLGKRRKKS